MPDVQTESFIQDVGTVRGQLRRWMIRILTILLSAGVAGVGCGRPRTATDTMPTAPSVLRIERVVDSVVPGMLAARMIPGAAVAVLSNDTLLLAKGYGTANLESGAPVSASTILQIGSTTKPFTAIVLLRLAEEGKVHFDSTARFYLPWLPPQYRDVTVLELLNHTSGVRYDLRRENIDEFPLDEFRRRLAVSEAAFPHGTRWQYSNTGYTLLALIAEAVSGQSFDTLLRERIFQLLGMSTAAYRDSSAGPAHATGYDLVDGTLRRQPRVFSGWGNSGIEASVIDIARWASALSRRELLRPESYRLMYQPAILRGGTSVDFEFSGARSSYGLGWFLTSYRANRLVTHGGAIAGFSSVVHRFDTLTIVVLSNGKAGADRRGQADAIGTAIYDALEPQVSPPVVPTPPP